MQFRSVAISIDGSIWKEIGKYILIYHNPGCTDVQYTTDEMMINQ